VKCIYPKAIREEEDLMDDIRSHISQSQENGSWDAMKYDIDPTLGINLEKRKTGRRRGGALFKLIF
jgi:hypothetical protein